MGNSHFESNLLGKNGTETITNVASVVATGIYGTTHIKGGAISGTTITGSGAISGTTITGSGAISGTNITGSGTVQGAVVKATSYITVGTNKYIFFGSYGTSASIISAATALVGTPISGSLYLGAGRLWIVSAPATANYINASALG